MVYVPNMPSPLQATNSALPTRRPTPSPHCVEAWLDVMRATDVLLRAGLRRQIGPEGDLEEAYRRWYAEHMREHDDAVQQLVRNLHRTSQDPDNGG